MEVLRAVEEVAGKRVPYRIVGRREGDPTELVADSSALRKTLRWEPRRSGIHEIIRDAWAYFTQQSAIRS
jgi:UDP-glucose 4-epimerase